MSKDKELDPKPEKRSDVGHCRTPKESRWKKGFCPNPNGRRGNKAKPQPTPSMPSELEQMLLRFFMAPMGKPDPTETTRFQHQLRTMHLSSKDKTEYGKLLLGLTLEAGRNKAQWDALVLREALAHKEEWGEKFQNARLLGRPVPAVYPHPDDIIIHRDLTVTFDGPITSESARQIKGLLALRDMTFTVVRDIIESDNLDIGLRREMWNVIRRKYYRYSPRIPKRLRIPFPAFVPSGGND